MTVRTRYAGSPTGYLHIGGAWNTFFVWLFARHHGGTMIIRVEDTDRSRSTVEFEQAVLADLRWLGLDWDEGPDIGGPHGPYRQTERLDLYRRHAQELLDRGAAYRCYCTPEELDAERKQAERERRSYRYSGRCRALSDEDRARFEAEGRRPVIRLRLKNYDRTIVVNDLIRGSVEFSPEHLDDHIIVRSNGWPLYNFANVVDDHTMAISHVIRGSEHLSNTPKQWVMYEALGWDPPRVAHLPVILGRDRKKLSKRHGDTSLRDYRREGYLPEALLNFFALMGWYPEEDREIYSVAELVERFRLEDIGKAGATFDLEKLKWMNGVYMRRLLEAAPERVVDVCIGVLQDRGILASSVSADDRVYVRRVIDALGERLKIGADIMSIGGFFLGDVVYDPAAVQKYLSRPQTGAVLRALADRISAVTEWNRDVAEALVRGLAGERSIDTREIIHPARVALTGKTIGPGLFELMDVLGKERVAARLRAGAAKAEEAA